MFAMYVYAIRTTVNLCQHAHQLVSKNIDILE